MPRTLKDKFRTRLKKYGLEPVALQRTGGYGSLSYRVIVKRIKSERAMSETSRQNVKKVIKDLGYLPTDVRLSKSSVWVTFMKWS